MLSKYSLNRLLVLFVAAGSLFLMVDSILEHLNVLSQEIMAYVPIAVGFVGFVFALIAAIRWNNGSIRALHFVLIGFLLVSIGGLYFHIEEEDDDEEMTEEMRQHEEKEKEKPLLAPLSFAGLAVVGLLGTTRKWPADIV